MSSLMSACERGALLLFNSCLSNSKPDLCIVDDEGNSLLHTCILGSKIWIRSKDVSRLAIMEALVKRGLDVNLRNAKGETALLLASRTQFLKGAELLLKSGADINIKDKGGCSPLRRALPLQCGDSIVELLLEHGADIEQVDCAVFKSICTNRYVRTVSVLLKYGLKLNALPHCESCPKRGTCLSLSSLIEREEFNLVKVLIKGGADVNVRDENGVQCIHSAAAVEDTRFLELLLEKRVDVNSPCKSLETPLWWACEQSNFSTMQMLLYEGADPYLRNISNESLMSFAVKVGNMKIIKRLDQLNVPLDKTYIKYHGGVRVSLMSAAAFLQHDRVFDFLVEKGLNVNEKESNGYSVIHFAVLGGSPQIVASILNKGVNVNIRTDDGYTPLAIALVKRCPTLCSLLVTFYGADINCRTFQQQGLSAIQQAIITSPPNFGNIDMEGRCTRASVLKQAIKLLAAGLDFSDTTTPSDILIDLKRLVTVKEPFYKQCTAEIDLIKQTRINCHTSLYDFLLRSTPRCAALLKDSSTEMLLTSLRPFNNLPLYSPMLTLKLNHSLRLKHLRAVAQRFFEWTEPRLLDDCIEVVLSYLDIHCLMKIETTVRGCNAIFTEGMEMNVVGSTIPRGPVQTATLLIREMFR